MDRQLLIVTDAVARDRDGEAVRVALDVLKGSSQARTVTPASPQELLQALERRGGRRPVVVGGEPTLHAVVEILHRRGELAGAAVGWVPLDTHADLAGSVGLPTDPAGAARVVLKGAERWLDLLVDDAGGVAVTSVRVGSGTFAGTAAGRPATAADAAGRPAAGRAGRGGGRLRVLTGRGTGRRLRVEADGKLLADWDRRQVRVGLGYGSAAAAPPFPDDGYAEVVVARAAGPLARFRRSSRGGGAPAADDVLQARTVTVEGEDFGYLADGVPCGPVRARTWTVHKSAWRLTVPPA